MSAQRLHFTKMHALGNDFVVVEALQQAFEVDSNGICKLGNRQLGVGFDQLLVIRRNVESQADFDLDIYNSDGTKAEQCGNGTLCVARFLADRNFSIKKTLSFQTLGGKVRVTVDGQNVFAKLALPLVDPAAVPFVASSASLQYKVRVDLDALAEVQVTPIGMGNPHAVLFTNPYAKHVEAVAHALQNHVRFPESVNVEFVEVLDRQTIRMRVFERGAGETLACGTGSCAAVAAAKLSGLVDQCVRVEQKGGVAEVYWAGADEEIELSAPTTFVFDGEIDIE